MAARLLLLGSVSHQSLAVANQCQVNLKPHREFFASYLYTYPGEATRLGPKKFPTSDCSGEVLAVETLVPLVECPDDKGIQSVQPFACFPGLLKKKVFTLVL